MDSDPYLSQRHGGPPNQQQGPQQSTLNSLLSSPSSFSSSMGQMYPGHPMQQQQPSFDGQGYPAMQYGQQMHGLPPGMQQNRGMPFMGQRSGPPGGVNRMGPTGVPMMRMEADKNQPDWMAFQQQQQLHQQQQQQQLQQQQVGPPYNPYMMQQPQQQQPSSGPAFPMGVPQPDMTGMDEEAPRPKSKKSKSKRSNSTSSTSPTPPSARSSAHQIQQQVLQQQMVPPPVEPDPPKKPNKKKKKKVEPPVEVPPMALPNQELDSGDAGFAPPSFFQQQMQQQQQQQPQRPQFSHAPHQFIPQGGPPSWNERLPPATWMQQPQQPLGPPHHMGQMGGGMPPGLGQNLGGPPQMDMNQQSGMGPQSAMNQPGGMVQPGSMVQPSGMSQQSNMSQQSSMSEPVSHTPSPSHSSSSSQNVYNQGREFPFATDVPATPPPKPKKSHSKKASPAVVEGEPGAEPWSGAEPPRPSTSHHGSGKSSIEKLSVLYEMGNEPDRRAVIDGIVKCSEEHNVPIINVPVIAKVSLDLYKFYKIVHSRGGYIEIHRNKAWKDIAGILGIISPNPNTAYTLKKQYVKFILPYEARVDRGGVDPESIIQAAESIPSKSPSRNRSNGDSKKRSRTHVSAVEQLSGSGDGSDGGSMLSQPPPPQYQPGPPQGQNFPPRNMQQFLGGQEGMQQYPPPPTGYQPQPTTGYPGAAPEMNQPGHTHPFWAQQAQQPGPATGQAIPFDGRGLRDEVYAPDGSRGTGDDGSQQQRGGAPQQQGGRPMGPGYGPPGMERQGDVGPRGMGHDISHDRRQMDNSQPAPLPPSFMSASIPAPAQGPQPPQFHERSASLSHLQAGQNQVAPGPPINNGPPRLHPGKDNRMMPVSGSPMAEPHQQRQQRLPGNIAQMQSQTQQPPPPVPDYYNFPPDSVEATGIVMRNRPRMSARDPNIGGAVDVWKLHMRMRSGLLAESGWAFEMLNIYTCDDMLCGQFNLANLPAGFLDTVVDWFQVAMYRLTDSRRPNGTKTIGGEEASGEMKPVPTAGELNAVSLDLGAYLENSHMRTHLDYPPWGDCEGREHLQELLAATTEEQRNGSVVPADGSGGLVANQADSQTQDQQKTGPEQLDSAVPFFLNLTTESEEEIGRKCIAISTSIRNLSGIHGNETHLARNQRLLSLIGKFITFGHHHLMEEAFSSKPTLDVPAEDPANASSASLFSVSFGGESDATGLDSVMDGSRLDDATIPTNVSVPWWQDVMEHVRENLLVVLANISGYTDLSECDETVCRPILEGLIHWTICPSSMAQEVLPTVVSQHQYGELSAKCLAMEAISKLSVTDANMDLLIAAPSGPELSKFIHELIQLLPCSVPWTATAHLLREFAMVILCSLVTCDERVCHIVAEHPFGLEYLTMILEEFDRMAQHGLKYDGHEGHMPTPNSAFSAMMLRKTIEILLAMADLPGVRSLLSKYQLRFWNLIVQYHFPDSMALSGLTKILLLLSGAETIVNT